MEELMYPCLVMLNFHFIQCQLQVDCYKFILMEKCFSVCCVDGCISNKLQYTSDKHETAYFTELWLSPKLLVMILDRGKSTEFLLACLNAWMHACVF